MLFFTIHYAKCVIGVISWLTYGSILGEECRIALRNFVLFAQLLMVLIWVTPTGLKGITGQYSAPVAS